MAERKTTVAIDGQSFLINGKPTYQGRRYRGLGEPSAGVSRRIAGLLLNSRMVQGIFDDLNPETRSLWDYPDGPWDPDRNTDEFIAAMPQWRCAGLLSFTLNLQGGNPQGYGPNQPWHNSAFTETGELREDYMARLARILDEADLLGMAPIVGYFYFGQDERFTGEDAVVRATEAATDWLLDRGYRNVLVEVGNEVDNHKYDQPILKAGRNHELIELVQRRSRGKVATRAGRLLVSTSLCGNVVPIAYPRIVQTSDFLLLHGNGVSDPNRIREMVDQTRSLPNYRDQPIVFNEDDHFDFEKDDNNMLAALERYASWGYFDYRMPGEGYGEGYQSVPVDWSTNSSARKRGFFRLMAEVTGSRYSGEQPDADC